MKSDVGQNGRICLYDNVRSVLICLVVVGHCIERYTGQSYLFRGIYEFIYSFHMPAFIFLAGMFHKNERVIPRAAAYLCIFFMMKLGFFLGNVLVSEADEPFRVFSESGIPWFIFILAGYTTATYILRDIDKRFLLLTAVMVGCFAGYDRTVGDLLVLSRGFVFYPFYILGGMCGRERLAAASRRPTLRFAGSTVLIGWAIVCFAFPEQLQPLGALLSGRSPFSEESFPWGPAWRLLHYAVSLALCFSVICVTPVRRLPMVTVMGGRTLQIYFWHWPIARAIDAVTGIGPLLCATAPGRIVWVLFGIALTFLLGTKPFSFPTDHILYFSGVRRKKPLFLPK